METNNKVLYFENFLKVIPATNKSQDRGTKEILNFCDAFLKNERIFNFGKPKRRVTVTFEDKGHTYDTLRRVGDPYYFDEVERITGHHEKGFWGEFAMPITDLSRAICYIARFPKEWIETDKGHVLEKRAAGPAFTALSQNLRRKNITVPVSEIYSASNLKKDETGTCVDFVKFAPIIKYGKSQIKIDIEKRKITLL